MKVDNQASFGNYKINKKSFQMLPIGRRPLVEKVITSGEQGLNKLSKGVKLMIEIKPDDINSVSVSVKKHKNSGTMTIPVESFEEIDKKGSIKPILSSFVEAFKNATKEKSKDPNKILQRFFGL